MSDAPIVDTRTTEKIEMRPTRPRPLSRYGSTCEMLGNYDIEKALKILDAKDWRNAESFLNPFGSEQVTLVHFAACRGDLRILERAAALHAPMCATDEFGRCALHYAAGQGHVDVVKWLLKHSTADERASGTESSAHPQLSLPDRHGRTALHQAVLAKHVEVVDLLVTAGANVNARDEQGVPPFLLAHVNVIRNDPAMVVRYEKIVDILAAGWASVTIIHPLTGWSALHYAVTLNSCRATDRLIKCGANPNCCRRGRRATTPVHLAARFGYHQTLHILLKNLPSSSIDMLNEHRWSPLHLAAALGNLQCARALVDKGGNLAKETRDGNTVIDLLSMFKHEADLVAFFTDMLDARVRLGDKVKGSAQIVYKIVLDFKVLTPEGQPQMAVISAVMKALSKTEQITILQHPVIEIYLGLKWLRLRYVFWSFVIVHIIFVSLLSGYSLTLIGADSDSTILRRMLLLSACVPFFHTMLQFVTRPKCYCRQSESWLSLIYMAISTVIAVACEFTPDMMMITPTSEHHGDLSKRRRPTWVLHAISIAILFAWIKIMLLAGRLPAWGFYALIFSTVLKNVVKVFLIGIGIIVSFTLSFSLVFHANEQFNNPTSAFFKTVVMLTGEYDYNDLFQASKNDSTAPNPDPDETQNTVLLFTGKIIFLMFVLLASIVLMNLMIGLAVSDIQGLVKEGQFSRLLKQAEFIADCERMTTAVIFPSRWIPTCLTNLLKSNIDREKDLLLHWGHKRHKDISKRMWKDLFKLCLKNQNLHQRFQRISGHLRTVDSAEWIDLSTVTFRPRCRTLDDELEEIYDYIN